MRPAWCWQYCLRLGLLGSALLACSDQEPTSDAVVESQTPPADDAALVDVGEMIAPMGDVPASDHHGSGGNSSAAVQQPLDPSQPVAGGASAAVDAGVLQMDEASPTLQHDILPGSIDTVAGTGMASNNGDFGPAREVNIGQPFGVEVGPDGALYITEVENHRVLRLDPETVELSTVAGTGTAGYSGDGGPATQAELREPYEVRFDSQGHMFIVEMQNHVVRRVDTVSSTISTIAGTGEQGYAGDGGPALSAQFNRPHSIALDGQGGLYIADIGNHRIRRVDLDNGNVETIAGTGAQVLPTDGQAAQGGPMLGPRALAMADGTLWIALREGHSVWRLPLATGKLEHIAGDGQIGFESGTLPAKQARFNGPKGIAVAANGHVFVVDTENQAIRRIDVAQRTVDTIAGGGPNQRGASGDGGPALDAQLNRPHGIAVSPSGMVYIGDSENHRVRAVNLP